ncbi:MAG: class I SAM-dependent methyltransferase [Pirellulales bacterium]|nr:class I SAM-dependent methyltransferase [Pirellulales bacterium]
MSVADLAHGLVVDEHGLFISSRNRTLAYPEEGNAVCFDLEDASFWFQHRNECISALVKRFPPAGTILDVGGGNGFVTRRLLDEGFDAALLEPGPVGALNGKVSRKIPTVICSTFEDARFPEASLDAVGCFDVIEHIENDHRFLEHVLAALRPGGLLYATVPAHRWLWSQSDDTAGHYRRYSRKRLVAALPDGFDMLYFTHFFASLTLAILLLRTLPHALGLSRKRRALSSRAEHGTGGGVAAGLLKGLLRGERRKIEKSEVIRLGSSCMFVARKKDH